MLVFGGLPLTVSSIKNHLFLLQHVFNRAMVLLGVADLLDIPSNRHHLCPLHDALNLAKDHIFVTGVLLTIPSTRNYLFLLLFILSTRPIPLGVASLPLTVPSTRNVFFLLHGIFNRIRMIFCDADFLLNFPSPRNHLFLLHRQCPFLHPEGI